MECIRRAWCDICEFFARIKSFLIQINPNDPREWGTSEKSFCRVTLNLRNSKRLSLRLQRYKQTIDTCCQAIWTIRFGEPWAPKKGDYGRRFRRHRLWIRTKATRVVGWPHSGNVGRGYAEKSPLSELTVTLASRRQLSKWFRFWHPKE